MAKSFIETEFEVGRFRKSCRAMIVGRLVRVHGTPCADLRVFVAGAEGEIATRAGICIARDKLPELARLVAVLAAASAGGAVGHKRTPAHNQEDGA